MTFIYSSVLLLPGMSLDFAVFCHKRIGGRCVNKCFYNILSEQKINIF